ncbi:MAG: four helix bundle protein [Deltaproteobacteria bacterium RBG_16_50_11]|nr:MAG: four helix bundle protein [Deltaproteobacteria bacterium RBG_16_50_11]
MKKVEELDVFKLSHSLTLEIYGITKSFPDEEKFGLISQMRKAAYSIPMNLMEGAHRLSSKEYRQFVGISRGSAGEMKYQLLLAKDLNYISGDQYSNLIPKYERVSQMLTRLAKSLE